VFVQTILVRKVDEIRHANKAGADEMSDAVKVMPTDTDRAAEVMAKSNSFSLNQIIKDLEDINDADEKIRKMLNDLPHPEDVDKNDIAVIAKIFVKDKNDFRPNNITGIVLGTFILFVCWLFFNAGST
jgi:hypothetical protein